MTAVLLVEVNVLWLHVQSLTNDLTRQRGLPSARGGQLSKPHPLEIIRRCKRETLFHSRFTCGMLSVLREWTAC